MSDLMNGLNWSKIVDEKEENDKRLSGIFGFVTL